MLEAAGIVLLVVLILVGALMPLKYTARLNLPRKQSRPPDGRSDGARDDVES